MEKVAIVGLSFDLPKTSDYEEFGNTLRNGIDTISNIEGASNKIPKAYIVDDMKMFDCKFFNLTSNEVLTMDPQHRIFLELCWKVLDQYGFLNNKKLLEKTGVFSAISTSDYFYNNIIQKSHDNISYSTYINNIPDTAATKVSYKFGLNGLSLSINSACSSGMVALKVAIDMLNNNSVEMALVGGCKLVANSSEGYKFIENSIFSKSGKCSPFDKDSDGMIPGNGGIVLALKRYDQALKDNDEILAIVNSIAVNNDGSDKNGFTSPSVEGQQKVIKAAFENSDIESKDIGYIEMHGTGTSLGDAIEISSTSRAFANNSQINIGSAKANYGHLDTISGLLGIAKSIWLLENGIIPKQGNFTSSNPLLNLDKNNFVVSRKSYSKNIKYIGINSFGIGGTNAHCILEKFNYKEQIVKKSNSKGKYVIPISTKNGEMLLIHQKNIAERLLGLSEKNKFRLIRTLIFDKKIYNNIAFIEYDTTTNKVICMENEVDDICGLYKERVDSLRNDYKELLQFRKINVPGEFLVKEEIWIEADSNSEILKTSSKNHSNIDKFIELIQSYEDIDKSEILNMRLKDFSIDSFLLIEMVDKMKSEFDINISFEQFLSSTMTFEDVFYSNDQNKSSINKFKNIQSLYEYSKEKKNIYVIHPAGGTVIGYKKIFHKESSNYNFILINYPFEKADVVSYFSLDQLANLYLNQIEELKLNDNNYILCGYSFGGNVAFEIARQLEEKNKLVDKVILIDSYPMDSYYTKDYQQVCYNSAFEVLKEELKKNGFPVDAVKDDEGLQLLFNVWKTNHIMLKRYKRCVKLSCDIVLFECTEEENPEILKVLEMKEMNKMLWEKYTSKSFDVNPILGNHYSIFSEDKVANLVGEEILKYFNFTLVDSERIAVI